MRRHTFRVELYSETLYRAVGRYLQPPARFGLLLYLGLQYIAGVYDFGVLIMIITYYGSVEYGLTGLSHITEVYLRASVAVRAIDDFVGEPVKKHPPTSSTCCPIESCTFPGTEPHERAHTRNSRGMIRAIARYSTWIRSPASDTSIRLVNQPVPSAVDFVNRLNQ